MYLRGILGSVLVAAVGIWAAPGTAQETPDLVVNGSFEEVGEDGLPVGWKTWLKELPEPGCLSVDETFAHSGERSLKISHRKPTSYSMVDQQVDFEAGKVYVITGWIKGDDIKPGDGAAQARLYIGKEGGNSFKVSKKFSGTFDWTYIEIGPFLVEERTWVTLIPYLHHSTGTVWFDDLTFREVPPAELHRLAQKEARDIALADLDIAEEVARKTNTEDVLEDIADLRERIRAADDLPTALDPIKGPPYFELHEEVFQLMARANRELWAGRDAVPEVYARWVEPFSDVAAAREAGPEPPRLKTLEMLGGELETACLRLTNLTEDRKTLSVSLEWPDDLDVPAIPPERVIWRVLKYVVTKDGQVLPDPLPKLGTGAEVELELPPGMTQDLWLMVDSTGLEAGMYWTGLVVTAGGEWRQPRLLKVKVHTAEFPEDIGIHTFAYAYTTWPLLKDRTEQSRADLRAHRINTYVIHGAFTPWPVFGEQGEWEGLDWTKMEEQIALHEGAKCLLVWQGLELGERLNKLTPEGGPEYPSAGWRTYTERWAKELAEGMRERGFGYDQWALYIVDEPSAGRAAIARTVGEAVDAADPDIRIFENPYGAASETDMELMAPVIDIWCPSLDTAHDERLAFCRETADEVWMYQVLGKTTPPLHSFRVAFWEAFDRDLKGFGFWDYADCRGSVWDAKDADRHDYAVVYDGDPEELIPSKRWEAYREGAEDHAMLEMMRARDEKSARKWVREVLEAPDAETVAKVRRRLVRAVGK